MAADPERLSAYEAASAGLPGELRAPIAGILGAAESLLKSLLDAEQDQQVRDIQRCARALLRVAGAPEAVETRPPDLSARVQPSLSGRRILVVRNSAASRRATRSLLERWGARVSSIDSAEQVFAFLEAGRRWDAAVIDANLRGDPGQGLAQRLLESASRVERLVALLPESPASTQLLAWQSRGARALRFPVAPGALLDALTG